MSCFYGDPEGLHLGQCQNFILDGKGGHYCLAPTIGLGGKYLTDRDICATCRAKTRQTGDKIMSRYGHAIATGGHVKEWLEENGHILADLDRRLYRELASGVPLSRVHNLKHSIRTYARCRDAVLAAVDAYGVVIHHPDQAVSA